VSAKRNDISKINKYLQGKLDAKAMHQLERDAQDDPFLMDALEGYEVTAKNQQQNIAELESRLAKRIADKKDRGILLWRVLPIAASVLLMIGAAYWFLKPKADKPRYANVIEPKVIQKIPTAVQPVPAKDSVEIIASKKAAMAKVGRPIIVGKVKTTSQADPASLIVKNNINKGATVEEILKKMKALEVDPKRNLLAQGKPAVTIRMDGKDFPSADTKTKAFGAKSQVIDTNYTYSGDPVVQGYVKRNKDLTIGNPYIVTGKEVQDNPVGNVEQLLQGKVAGLNVKNNTGAPGMRGTVNIRGLSAIDSSKWAAMAKDASKKYITVTGEVKDIYGEAMVGATIGTAGKGLTQVDVNGKFTVTIPADINTLVATNIGYKSQIIKIDKQTTLNIKLAPDNRSLSEVVIRGYIKRNRDETTGSSYIVTGKDAKKSAGAADNIGQGKVPGKFLPINPRPTAKEQAPNSNCNENLKFKDQFFDNITIAEKHTMEKTGNHQSTVSYRRFLKALTFISKYAPVSINPDKKSNAGYPDLKSFQSEKAQWLEWYEANKCNNLK
jgi:hypothetical protein